MIRRGYNSYLLKIINLMKKTDKGNKKALSVSVIILIISVATIVFSISYNEEMRNLSQQSAESANRSAQIANVALNETKKLVNWTEPKPNIQIWSDKDYWGKNGTVYMIISPDYSPDTGIKGFSTPPGFYWGPITIDFLIFNSGKAPVVSSICYIGLDCTETKDIFPFKIYNISTPLQSLFYNINTSSMIQSFMTNFPFPNKAELPYWQWNEKNVLDFPPSYKYGKVAFRNLILPYQYYATKINYNNQSIWDSSIGSIGPFAIGNIEPGETKHVYVSIFGAVSNYTNMIFNSTINMSPYAVGTFMITVKSANCKMISYSFPIKSFERPP